MVEEHEFSPTAAAPATKTSLTIPSDADRAPPTSDRPTTPRSPIKEKVEKVKQEVKQEFSMFSRNKRRRRSVASVFSGGGRKSGEEHHHPHMPHAEDIHLPRFNHNGHKVTKGIHPDGESGRGGIHPWHFTRICARSSSTASATVNILWPVVPAAIAVHFARPEWHLAIFILNYIAMVPSANLIGFAGQELARKLPRVFGVILETTLGSVVEIVLFMVLLRTNQPVTVIKAAILGSILANLLLCLGFCFLIGGTNHAEQTFHEAVSEVGSNLMLVAGTGLILPAAYFWSLQGRLPSEQLEAQALTVSRATAIILLVAFIVYTWFQMRSHHSVFDELLEMDEMNDEDRDKDLRKDKLTFVECLVALGIALAFVSLIATFLVLEIPFIVEDHGVSEEFMGLILVPVVEKFSEHLTAVDEAHDNQANFALVHVLGSSIQTALLNTPLVVIAGWGLHRPMDLAFDPFSSITLILAILVVGNFLRDGKSNYLEGTLCIFVYIIVAIAAFYNNAPSEGSATEGSAGQGDIPSTATATMTAAATSAVSEVARMLFS